MFFAPHVNVTALGKDENRSHGKDHEAHNNFPHTDILKKRPSPGRVG
jgi:hypothetical protein